jgi:Zn-dependent protease with chaperone function
LRPALSRRRVLLAVVLVALAAGWAIAAVYLWDTRVPGDLRRPELDADDEFSRGELERTSRYERFVRVNFLLSQLVLVGVLALYAWRGHRLMRESAAGRIGTGMLLGMLGLALVWLAQVPFGLAELWWQRRHGLSRVEYPAWIVDNWLSLGGEFLFICLAILVVMALARFLRQRWWVVGGPFFVGLALLFVFVYPYLLPNLGSLRDPELRADARELADEQGLDAVPVKVEEVDEFTSAPNAEAAGLGPSRRVVLWNTLLSGRFGEGEIRFVLAHELAHHSRDHLWKSVGWYALFAVPGAFLIAFFTRRRGGLARPEAVPLSLFVLVVLQLLAAPLQNAIGRQLETEADWVALETTEDPDAARALFRRFASTTLTEPDPPAWAHLLFDTHPTLEERIEMAAAWERRAMP